MTTTSPAAATPARRDAFLVSTDWLAGHLDDPRVRVVDCRFYFDDPGRGQRAYLESHIPGAQYLNWTTDISAPRGHLQYMAPPAAAFQDAMRRLGIHDDSLVVGYDDEGGHYVARLWLLMRRFGRDGVRVLDGGWTRWTREGRPTRGGAEPAPAPGTFTIGAERPSLLVEADDVLRGRDDPRTLLLDVRRLSEFSGEEVRSRHGGHIPWARWLFWQENLDWEGDRTFRDEAFLRQRLEAAGVTPDRRVIAYCHGGVRAGHTAFTLAMLGYPDVQVYDGSWEEWGSRDDLPIARGGPDAATGDG